MKGLLTNLLILLIFLLQFGCSTAPQLSSMQVRQLTSKIIEGSYEDVFRASMTVIQDKGYVIKNTDMNSGLIVANVDKETASGSQFLQALFVGSVYDKNTVVEVSETINKLSEKSQEIRLSIQETQYSANGNKQDIKQILDEKMFQNFFNEITLEVKRREAING